MLIQFTSGLLQTSISVISAFTAMLPVLICLTLVSFSACGEGAVKRWLSDTKWETGRNWQSGKPPCAGQRASLGHAHGLSVYLGSEVQLGALVFPKTGELVLDEGAALGFESFETDGDCVGEAQFTAQERVHWYNPDHWALRQSSQLLPEPVENRPDTEPRPPAVPDSEMVPCPSDFVVFEDERFRVDMDGLSPKVREVQIGDRIYGGPEMSALLSGDEGRAMFSGYLTSGSPDCREPEGCACGNDQPEPLERICLQHAPRCAENLPCQDSIVMIGNCCPICASALLIHPGPNFVFDDVVQLLFNDIVKPKYGGHVQAYVHRTYTGLIQVITVDLGTTINGMPIEPGKAHKLATDIYETITGKDAERYSVLSASLSGSEKWNSTLAGGSGASQGGSVAGIVLGVLFALLLLAGAIYVFYRRYGFRHPRTLFRGRPLLPMARFDDGRIELELGTTPHDALVPSGDEPSFENPLAGPFESFPHYGAGEKKEPAGTFSNPVYEETKSEKSQDESQ
uniref:Protein amnionless n=1 Tax=Rhipicephalus zambeziensis TaxID=60191 RepID=A0A224YP52_9ACAR